MTRTSFFPDKFKPFNFTLTQIRQVIEFASEQLIVGVGGNVKDVTVELKLYKDEQTTQFKYYSDFESFLLQFSDWQKSSGHLEISLYYHENLVRLQNGQGRSTEPVFRHLMFKLSPSSSFLSISSDELFWTYSTRDLMIPFLKKYETYRLSPMIAVFLPLIILIAVVWGFGLYLSLTGNSVGIFIMMTIGVSAMWAPGIVRKFEAKYPRNRIDLSISPGVYSTRIDYRSLEHQALN